MVQERFYNFCNQRHHEIVFFYLMKDCDNIDIQNNTFTDQGTDETLHWLPISHLSEFPVVPEFLLEYFKIKPLNTIKTIEHIIIKE